MQGDDLLEEIRRLGGIEGQWWLPKTPDERVHGRLFFVNENLELEVEHGFHPVSEWRLPVPEVLGLLRDGTECSLSELRGVSMVANRVETSRTIYAIQLALLGIQTEHPNQLRIRRMRLPLSAGADWADLLCYDLQSRGHGFSVNCSGRRMVSLGTANGVKLTISTGIGWDIASLPSQGPILKVSSEVDMSIKNGQSLESVLQYVPMIASFFSLATLSPIAFDHLSCESNEARRAAPANALHKRTRYWYQPLVIWYDGLPASATASGLNSRDMFVTFSDLKHARQSDILSRLLAQRAEFEYVLPLMIPESGRFHTYSGQRFLNAAQVLETLDRMAGDNEDLDPDVFSSVKKKILENVEDPEPGWLEGLLEYANEPCLRTRLKRVMKRNSSLLRATSGKKKAFINDAINTRNYLVHLDSEKKTKAVLDVRLVDLTDKVEALARFTFLRHFGFSEDDLAYLLQQTERRYIQSLKVLF